MSRYKPRGVITKTLYDRRWFILAWVVGLAFMAWFVGIFYETFGKSDILNQQLKDLPPSMRSIAGVSDNFNTVAGYYGAQIFGKTMPIIAAILGITLGTSIATEEENGTLQTLLAAPISRTKIYVSKWLASLGILALVTLGLALGLALSLWQQGLSLDVWRVMQGLSNIWLFAVFFLSLTFTIGAIWGRRSLAIAVGSLMAVAGYLLNTMAAGVESLKPYDKFSPYYYYGSENILEKGLHVGNFTLLAFISAILLVIGAVVFARRNIAAA